MPRLTKLTRAIWTRRLSYRRNRRNYWQRKGDTRKVQYWQQRVNEAKVALGLPVKPKRKPVPPKPKPNPPKPKPQPPQSAPKPKPKPKPPAKKSKGIDVYEGDGNINWKQVKDAGYDFAFCKTTEGGDFKDKSWSAKRVNAMRDAGVKVGVYHFLRPKAGRSGADEMRFFIEQARNAGWGKPGDLLPVIDFEATTLSPAQTRTYVQEAVREVKRLLGHPPIIYTGGPFWNENTNSWTDDLGCELWLAAYVNNPEAYLPAAWKKTGWAIWQHTDKGPVPGVAASDVDQNVSRRLPTL